MKIEGIFTPNMVPLDSSGEINEPELRRYIDWLIDRGVHGLYPNGSTGEFTRFNPQERRRIVQIVCHQVAGRVPVLAGAAEANVRETIQACEAYLEFGAGLSPSFHLFTIGYLQNRFIHTSPKSPDTLRSISRFTTSRCSPLRSMFLQFGDCPSCHELSESKILPVIFRSCFA